MHLATAILKPPGVGMHADTPWFESGGIPIGFGLGHSSAALAFKDLLGHRRLLFFCANLFSLGMLYLSVITCSASDSPVSTARKTFGLAQVRYQQKPTEPEAGWKFARPCFDLAECATNSNERAELAEKGIAACKQLLSREPDLAPAHYYLAMNFGQLARTKGIGALKLVKEIEREFIATARLDELFDFAGADRNLGVLYRDAPSLGSIGSRTRARHHLQRAVELSPDYPDNRLSWIETLIKWNDRIAARKEFKALEETLPQAQETFHGDAWTASWAGWEARLKEIQKQIQEHPKALEAPS